MPSRRSAGLPALLVPDNTKVAAIKACLYDPQINRSYADMAAHYGIASLPARPRRPRDKVEQAVLMVERWLLGRLRHRTFRSLAEVNAAIAELLTRLNEEPPIRRLGVTRRKLLEEIDRPALKVLPESPYVFAADLPGQHRLSRRGRASLRRAEVEGRFTARTVEIFHKGERIAAHQRMSATTSTRPCWSTWRPVIGATPAGPSSASARMPPRSGRPPRRCAA